MAQIYLIRGSYREDIMEVARKMAAATDGCAARMAETMAGCISGLNAQIIIWSAQGGGKTDATQKMLEALIAEAKKKTEAELFEPRNRAERRHAPSAAASRAADRKLQTYKHYQAKSYQSPRQSPFPKGKRLSLTHKVKR